jgi:hypothetical protein
MGNKVKVAAVALGHGQGQWQQMPLRLQVTVWAMKEGKARQRGHGGHRVCSGGSCCLERLG